jgi:glycosyltransferase involved in cell wall biosynthesis
LKKLLNLNKDSIIIGSSGAEIFRKGKDWFIQLAITLKSIYPSKDIHFVWVGGELNSELEFDLKKSNLSDQLHFVKHLPAANKYFHEFDIFAMLSRDDPFPLVNLEVAALGVPIVCFENAGGTPELVEKGCGYSVQYGNIAAFASKVSELIDNPILYQDLSTNAIKIVVKNYDISIIVPQIIELIIKNTVNR